MARLESYNKHLYRPNTFLHKWWARRCGTTFRLLLKHLVAEEGKRDYYEPGGLEGKIVLDPMIGGGTILHEAIRLGANVIGVDIDPIPVLQARASLAKVSNTELFEGFENLFEILKEKLDPVFITTCPLCEGITHLQFMLYGLKCHCNCGPVILVDSLTLRQESNGHVIKLCSSCHQIITDKQSCACTVEDTNPPLRVKGKRNCPKCLAPYVVDLSLPFYERYFPLVKVGRCKKHNLFFAPLTDADLKLIDLANEQRHNIKFDTSFEVSPGSKAIDLIRREIRNYTDLFSSRQLLFLHEFRNLLKDQEPILKLYVALIGSTSLEFNSMLCGYKGVGNRRAGAIRHAFSYHAYSFPYTALENNPVYGLPTSGTLLRLFNDRVKRAREWSEKPRERVLGSKRIRFTPIVGESDYGIEVNHFEDLTDGTHKFLLRQNSSVALNLPDDSIDYIVTDPPYYDSIQYSDLAEFFRVWLRQFLYEYSGENIDWDYPRLDSAVATNSNHGNEPAEYHYQELLGKVFSECHRVLRKDSGRLVFSYHHWKADSWAALTVALKQANFLLVNRYVVHSENLLSVHIANLNALTDDAILVLAPGETGIANDWNKPVVIDRSSSAHFCRDCATLVGWMLANRLRDQDIIAIWRSSLLGFEVRI